MNDLEKNSTEQLVEELKKREGVNATIVEPYEIKTLEIEGSAIVLTVID